MAQVNLTLSEQEVLQVITGNRDEALKFLLERILNELMQAESQEQLGASRSERTDSRTDYRNGVRERDLNTRIGKITLKVPRHRNEPFHTMVFDNYSRSEASLIAAMVQMVIAYKKSGKSSADSMWNELFKIDSFKTVPKAGSGNICFQEQISRSYDRSVPDGRCNIF